MGGYENTSRLPDLETLKKIAQLFDISLDYVAGYTDVPYTLKKRREISDEEMEARRAEWKPRQPKITTGYLARYAALVTSGNRGAILEAK